MIYTHEELDDLIEVYSGTSCIERTVTELAFHIQNLMVSQQHMIAKAVELGGEDRRIIARLEDQLARQTKITNLLLMASEIK